MQLRFVIMTVYLTRIIRSALAAALFIMPVAFSCFSTGASAQNLTHRYIELADSADNYIKHERWNDAERTLVAALRSDPANKSNYLIWSNLGYVRTQLNDYPGASEAIEIGLAQAPKSTVLLTQKGRTELTFGHNEKALEAFDKALEVDSTLQWPRQMRGMLCLRKRDVEGAEKDFDTYERLHGANNAVIKTGRAQIATLRNKPKEAIAFYDEAYKLDPDELYAVNKFLTAYYFNMLTDVEEDLREAIQKYPRSGTLYLMRAALHKERYQPEEAKLDKRLALEYGADPALADRIVP